MPNEFPTRKFPNSIPGLDMQATLDGTARKRWEDHEGKGLPKHLIRHDVDHLECTCGYKAADMTDWGRHVSKESERIHDLAKGEE